MVTSSASPRTLTQSIRLVIVFDLLFLICWGIVWYALRNSPYVLAPIIPHAQRIAALLRFCTVSLMFLSLAVLYIALCRQLAALGGAGKVPRWYAVFLSVILLGTAAANVALVPALRTDVYYYVCVLKLKYFYGQNPYLTTFLPRFSSDSFAHCASFLHVPSIYGPAWFLVSWPAVAFADFGSVSSPLLGYKIWSVLFVLASGGLVATYGDERRERWLGASCFLLNPLIWYTSVGTAHNDIIMATFVLAAAWVAKKQPSKWWWVVFPLLAIAILVKITAAVLAWVFVVYLRRQGWGWRRFALSGLIAFVLAILILLPFWAGGAMLHGWMRSFSTTISLGTGSPFSLIRESLRHVGAPPIVSSGVRLLGAGALIALILLSPRYIRHFEHNLAVVIAGSYLLQGTLLPWYLVTIMGLLALHPNRTALRYLFPASLLALQYPILDIGTRQLSLLYYYPLLVHLMEGCLLSVPLILLVITLLRSGRAADDLRAAS